MAEDKAITEAKKRFEEKGMEKVELDVWDFEKNKVLEGHFVGVEKEIGRHKSNLYSVRLEDGRVVQVWGSTILDTRLKNVEMGDEVAIIYHGKYVGKSGSKYKNFEVYHGKPKPVSAKEREMDEAIGESLDGSE